jgi:diphosphomevalonate decarboxylase
MAWAAANSNLALVKYWGKSPMVNGGQEAAAGSISVTLEGLTTVAEVRLDPALPEDRLDMLSAPAAIRTFLDLARERLAMRAHAEVRLATNFPVAAGLASSASTFAALALALATDAGRGLDADDLTALARLGSGSAGRSVLGGFVEWIASESGSRVVEVAPAGHWPLSVLIAVTSEAPKRVASRDGMERTRLTSPYYEAWLRAGSADLAPVREAIRRRDLDALGAAIERNCLRMHAAALGSDPPLLYWEAATVAVIREVWRLRTEGVRAFFSIDAGPQVKVLCDAADASRVDSSLRSVPGVVRVIRSRPGRGALRLDEPPSWARAGLGLAARAGEARP